MTDFERDREAMTDSAARVEETVAALDDRALRGESLLPDWSRGHVLAHLILNAEGMARALASLGEDEPQPVYDSSESRDADVEELAPASHEELAQRLHVANESLAAVLATVRPEDLERILPRVPGAPGFLVREVPMTRRRELEIHHADLDAGYPYTAWPQDFAAQLLDKVSVDRSADGPFVARATDLGRDWTVGEPVANAAVVSGTGAALGWWLTGRFGAELRVDGDFPMLGDWVQKRR